MKIAALIARYLLGIEFLVFGANHLVNFLHMPVPGGLAGQYEGALFLSHIFVVVGLLQVLSALLLLAGRYVPLALTLLGPIVVNIVLFHALILPMGLPIALLTAIFWLLVFYQHRAAFAGIFAANS